LEIQENLTRDIESNEMQPTANFKAQAPSPMTDASSSRGPALFFASRTLSAIVPPSLPLFGTVLAKVDLSALRPVCPGHWRRRLLLNKRSLRR
jgi:hypothetical protein